MNHPVIPDQMPDQIRSLLSMEGITMESAILIEATITAGEPEPDVFE